MDRCASILLVEDDPDAQEMLRTALEANGYRVSTAADARAALDRLRSSEETSCVLLDLNLGGSDGTQFRTAQQRDRSLAWIPVIVVSAQPGGEDVARRLGARAFLRKPFDLDRLLQVLERTVKEARARPMRLRRPDPSPQR